MEELYVFGTGNANATHYTIPVLPCVTETSISWSMPAAATESCGFWKI